MLIVYALWGVMLLKMLKHKPTIRRRDSEAEAKSMKIIGRIKKISGFYKVVVLGFAGFNLCIICATLEVNMLLTANYWNNHYVSIIFIITTTLFSFFIIFTFKNKNTIE